MLLAMQLPAGSCKLIIAAKNGHSGLGTYTPISAGHSQARELQLSMGIESKSSLWEITKQRPQPAMTKFVDAWLHCDHDSLKLASSHVSSNDSTVKSEANSHTENLGSTLNLWHSLHTR
jgi:hypothetical protein